MADQVSNHVVRVEADFSDFVRAAKKASDRSSDVLSKAIEVGIRERSFMGFMKGVKRFEKKRADLDKKYQALSYAHQVKSANKLGEALKDIHEEIAKLERDLAADNLAAEVKNRKRAEYNLYKEKRRLLDQLNEGMVDGFTDALAAVNRELREITEEQEKAARTMTRATEQVERGTERAAGFMRMFRRDATRGADDFNESITSTLENLSGGQSIRGAGGLAKGIGGMAEILGGIGAAGGAMAGLATAASGLLLVLGPLVAAFGVFAGLMFEMDKEIKGFNKSAINTFGTRSVMAVGMPTLDDNLKVLRHSVQDLTQTLGLNEEEAMGVFDAYDQGGITLARLTKGATDAAEAERNLQDALRGTVAVAKSLGVGVNEFAGQLAEYTDTLAFSLESVTGQFALVSKQAADAGFSTRRFYSFIVQASAGQASLNTHLDQTAELLTNISKSLGMKAAAEVIGGAAGGFQEMSTQERYKTILTSGKGNISRTISQSAEHQARTFQADIDPQKLAEALSISGVGGLGQSTLSDPEKLVDRLADLTRDEQARVVAALESSSDQSVQQQGRRLDQLIQISRGTSGNMADMADAMSSLDPGATIVAKLQSAMAILSRPLDELSGVDRMAAESITGMQGRQFEQYATIARQAHGDFAILTGANKEAAQEMADRLGLHFDEQGRVLDENGQVIERQEDLLADLVRATPASKTLSAEEESLNLAEESFDATTTIADILGNQVVNYLRDIYEVVGLPLVDIVTDIASHFIEGLPSKEERQTAGDLRGELSQMVSDAETVRSSSSALARALTRLGEKRELTADEQSQLETAQSHQSAAETVIARGRKTISSLRRGIPEGTSAADYAARVRGGIHGAYGTMTSGGPLPQAAPTETSASQAREEQADAIAEPVVASVDQVVMTTADQGEETRSAISTAADDQQKHVTKLFTKDKRVGDMLGRSDLPQAIVDAQVKQQFASLAFASGLQKDEDIANALTSYFEEGKLSDELRNALTSSGAFDEGSPLAGAMAALGIMPGARGAAAAGALHRSPLAETGASDIRDMPEVDDFVYRGDGVRGTITPIDTADTLVGSKEGGALDRLSGSTNVSISIYGGDERRVFDVVKRVLGQAGLGPGRVTARA